jgi:8-oxo-dGTP pyrophosphatase MutT (NUDIX family)
MELSAGFVIVCDDKILLTHPTLSKTKNSWGIPKGKIENGEDLKQAALRETNEEIGIDLTVLLKGHVLTWYVINYTNKSKGLYKKLYYSVIKVESLEYLNLSSDIMEHNKLSIREIDKAQFFTKEEANKIIFWRQKNILKWI